MLFTYNFWVRQTFYPEMKPYKSSVRVKRESSMWCKHFWLKVIFVFKKVIKIGKFDMTPNDIRTAKIISTLIWACLGHIIFYILEVSAILDVRHCPKLKSCAISRKTNDTNLRKVKNLSFVPNFGLPDFTRPCCKLSSYAIFRKIIKPNFRRWRKN